jgi:alpha-1,2-mannosyltransferase
MDPVQRPGAVARLGLGALIRLLPCLVAVFIAGSSWGAPLVPWEPKQADLEVYLRAARVLLSGGDVYNLPDSLPFLYPPFAAILAVPLSALPHWLVQAGWAVGIGLTVVAVLRRMGLTGWRLSLIAAAAIRVVEPINQTVAFGQLGAFLVGLVVLDLIPRPGAPTASSPGPDRSRRRVPEGIMVGLATAIKLTPGLFFVYLLAIRRYRTAAVAIATMLATSLLALLLARDTSITFWSRLAHGDSGLGDSIIYLLNQSVIGATTRILGYNAVGNGLGLVLAVVAAVLGVLAAVRWHRRGDEAMAVTICGIATLLASPVSWSHHFVWIAPLGVLLATRRWPTWFRILGWCFVGGVAPAPYKFLPSSHDVERGYFWWQNAFGAVTPALGMAVLVASALVLAGPARSRLSRPVSPSTADQPEPAERASSVADR